MSFPKSNIKRNKGVGELPINGPRKRWISVVQALVIILGTWVLMYSDAYIMPYIIVSGSALLCLMFNFKMDISYSRFEVARLTLFSFLYVLMVTLANYNLWWGGGLEGMVKLLLISLGTFFSCVNILSFMTNWKDYGSPTTLNNNLSKSRMSFWLAFLLILIINCSVFFLCKYPGVLSPDSFDQIQQCLYGGYGNAHPFYHTMLVKLFLRIGLFFGGDINAAVAVFMVFQICFMAFCFSYAAKTVKEAGAPNWMVAMLIVFFAFMPYHIVYSFTLWKDVIFGGSVLLFTIYLYRVLKPIGNSNLNMIGMCFSGMGVCLMRNNGFLAFVGTTFFFLLLFGKQHKKLVVFLTVIILVCFILKHPVLKKFGVESVPLTESLSIPIQQVARDVIENDDFTEEEYALITKVAGIERIEDSYVPYISDPMKDVIREKDGDRILSEFKADYINLYFSRLLLHPSTYMKAWIDQTKGYWNSGYQYWVYSVSVNENDLGIKAKVLCPGLNSLVNHYLSHSTKHILVKPIISIGLFVWCVLAFLYIAIIKKNKLLALMTIPSLMVIVSLLIATPVFSEFRYAYPVFCTMPVIGIMAYIGYGKTNSANTKQINNGQNCSIDTLL